MPTYDIIGGIVSQSAITELEKLRNIAREIADNFKNIQNLSSAGIGQGGASITAGQKRMLDAINATNLALLRQQTEMQRTAAAQARAQAAAAAAAAAQQRLNNVTNNSTGYLNELEAKLKTLTQEYKSLTKAEFDDVNIGGAKLEQLKQVREELAKAKSAYGDNTMNVGNYSSATKMLGINIGQVLKEMPNFAISMRTGIMSLTNNLPMLAETIAKVREEQLAMVAAGQKAPSMFSLIAKSVFGLTGIMSVLMVLLQLFSGDILEWISNLFKAEKSLDKLSASAIGLESRLTILRKSISGTGNEYGKAIKSIIELSAHLKNSIGNTKESTYYTKQYNETLGDTFGKAKNASEAIGLINKNKDAYIEAMKQMAYANALFEVSAEDITKMLEVNLKSEGQLVRDAGYNYTEMYDNIKKLKKDSKEALDLYNKQLETQLEISRTGFIIKKGKFGEIKERATKEDLESMNNYTNKLYNDYLVIENIITQEENKIGNIKKTERIRQLGIIKNHLSDVEKEANKYAKNMSDIWDKNNWGFPTTETVEKEGRDLQVKMTQIFGKLRGIQNPVNPVNAPIPAFGGGNELFNSQLSALNVLYENGLMKYDDYLKKRSELYDTASKMGYKQTEENANKNADIDMNHEQMMLDYKTEMANRTVDALKDIWRSYFYFFEKQLEDQKDKEQKIEDEKLKEIEDREKSGVLTKEKAEEEKLRTQTYYDSVYDEIDRKKKDAEKQQFFLNQLAALAGVWINYWKSVGSFENMMAGGAFTPLYLGIASLSTASIAAQTIPYFEEGVENFEGGLAVVGEKRHEMVINPDGSFFITPDRPTLMELQKGSTVLPDANKFDLNTILAMKQIGLSSNNENTAILKDIARSIKNQKQGNFYGMPLIKQLQRSEKLAYRNKSLLN